MGKSAVQRRPQIRQRIKPIIDAAKERARSAAGQNQPKLRAWAVTFVCGRIEQVPRASVHTVRARARIIHARECTTPNCEIMSVARCD